MKHIVIKTDDTCFTETMIFNLENDPERSVILEFLEDSDESELFDIFCEKEENGETVNLPTFIEPDILLSVEVEGHEVFSDYITIGKDVKITDIGYPEDLCDEGEDRKLLGINRNGFHESAYDNVLGLDKKCWDDAMIRWSSLKGGLQFEFDIPDGEEFSMDKLSFLWDCSENFLFGDDKIDGMHILYDNTVFPMEDMDSGEEKGWGYERGKVWSDGSIEEYWGYDDDDDDDCD